MLSLFLRKLTLAQAQSGTLSRPLEERTLSSVGFQPFPLDSLRARLRKMSDEELTRFGRAATGVCSPEASFGHAPRQVFVEQLSEARAELAASASC